MSILIICEKPSVAKTIAGALGAKEQKDGYIQGNGLLVSWCIGHLVSMADAGSYDERFTDNQNTHSLSSCSSVCNGTLPSAP